MEPKAHAAFVVAPIRIRGNRRIYAATTRAADRGEAGRIGLPGGKIDIGESALDAALREAREEGWRILGDRREIRLIHEAEVEGRLVQWFRAPAALPLDDWKERGRIYPIAAPLELIASGGFGNEFLTGGVS